MTAIHWLDGCLASGRRKFRSKANMGRASGGFRAAQGMAQQLQGVVRQLVLSDALA
jgi:hypothetical protein